MCVGFRGTFFASNLNLFFGTIDSMSNKRDITSFFSPAGKRTRREKVDIESVPSLPSLEENETTETVEEESKESPAPLPNAVDDIPSNEATTTISNIATEKPLFDLGTWSDLLQNEFTKTYFRNLMRFVDREYSTATVYPPREQIFSAFLTCDLNELKVVIIGQDPYHGPHQAHGLSFSVLEGNAPPPSLRNIFKEARVSRAAFFLLLISPHRPISESPHQSTATSPVGVAKESFFSIMFSQSEMRNQILIKIKDGKSSLML
jgi:hypothetical protein